MLSRRFGLLLLVAVLTAPLQAGLATAEPITAAAVTCRSDVPFFLADAHGGLTLTRHAEPETGVESGAWTTGKGIGAGWNGNLRVGPDGWVYLITPEHKVIRHRWLGSGWANGGKPEELPAFPGRRAPGESAARNQMAVDELGDFYSFELGGSLRWSRYDDATRTWQSRAIDTSSRWILGGYDMIFTAGPGVFYARERQAGALHRFQYDATSERWIEYARVVGASGWNKFTDATGVGGDIFYVLDGSTNTLKWYRYIGNGQFATGSGKTVATNWPGDLRIDATSDSCKPAPDGLPVRPVVPAVPHAPANLLATADGRLHYSYVDGENRVVNAQVTDLTGGAPFGFAAIPGNFGTTGTPALADAKDNRVRLLALGLDSDVRANRQAASNGAWGPTEKVGGFLVSSPGLARIGDEFKAFGIDEAGCLWQRTFRAESDRTPWSRQSCQDLAPETPVVAGSGDKWFLTVRKRSGSYLTAQLTGCCTWTSLPATGFTGPAAVVVDGSGLRRLFARGADGLVYVAVESGANTFGAWTAIAGITAAGNPSAVLAPSGLYEVVVRGTDGYLYNTGQLAPGSPNWRPWREITDYAEESSTDPTAVTVPGQNVWVVAFRDVNDAPKLRRAQTATPVAAAASDTARFVDVLLIAAS